MKKENVYEQDNDINSENSKSDKKTLKEEKKAAKREAKAAKKSGSVAFLMLKIIIAVVLVLVIFYFGFTCTVREGNVAIITRFGEPITTITDAGLHFKLPWPFEDVITYDGREQYYETTQLETLTMDRKSNVLFQSYVVWKIDDPLKFHMATTKDDGSIDINAAIQTSVDDAINTVMGKYNLSDLVSSTNENLKTDEIQEEIFKRVKKSCGNTYSIEIIDVSILRLSYPTDTMNRIIEKIKTDRNIEITNITNEASKEANDIIISANDEATKIRGEAAEEVSKIRADAEKAVAEIYAAAQEANIELFKFLKELDTIVNSVNANTVLVVDSNAYPFNILLEYGQIVDENTSVITELEYIMSVLSEEDREALVDAILLLLSTQGNQGNAESESGVTDSTESIEENVESNIESSADTTETGGT